MSLQLLGRAATRASASSLLARNLIREHNTASATAGMMDICIIDPLLVLEPERLATAAASSTGDAAAVQPYVTVSVPFRLLAQLHKARLELADHDDPGNHWRMGEEGELFQYKFVGRHSVQSGFTSVLLAHELAALRHAGHSREGRPSRKQAAAGLEERSWLAFLQHVKGSSGEGLWPTPSLPFLFAGKAIDCASVGVYTLGEGSGCRGLQLSSEYETPGAE